MSSLIYLRRKLKSTQSTRQITKAMQMVAASKMQKAQQTVFKSRPFYLETLELLAQLQLDSHLQSHPLLLERPVKTKVWIVLGSNRGLCGAYNWQILKKVQEALLAETAQIELIAVGAKIDEGLKRMGYQPVASFADMPENPVPEDLKPLLECSLNRFIAKEVDAVQLIYTEYFSALRQTVTLKNILPIPTGKQDEKNSMREYLFEPSKLELMEQLVPFLITNEYFQAIYHALASEYSQRMMAMKSATDNASEMLSLLRLDYNRLRQAKITQEISEIAVAADAV